MAAVKMSVLGRTRKPSVKLLAASDPQRTTRATLRTRPESRARPPEVAGSSLVAPLSRMPLGACDCDIDPLSAQT